MKNKKTKIENKEMLLPMEEAQSLFDSGMKHRDLKHHDEALEYFQKSLKLLVDNNQVANDLTAQVINMIGDEYDAIANAQPENLQYRLDSLTSMRALLPEVHSASAAQMARGMNNVGSYYLALNNNAEALKYFNQAMITLKSKFPFASHPYTDTIKNNILKICAAISDAGNSYQSLGKYAEALECFNLVSQSLKNAFSEGHKIADYAQNSVLKIMTKFHEIGAELLKQNKHEDALKVFVKISDVMLQNLVTPASILLIKTS